MYLVEHLDNIKIVRTAIFPSQKASMIPRLLNYFSFVFSSLLLGYSSIGNPDVIFTESPPLFLGISGYLLSRLKKCKWIFNVSDLWPESAVRVGVLRRESFFYRVALGLEKFCYQHAWLVSGQSRSILADIRSRFPHVPYYHFLNGVNPDEFQPHWKTSGYLTERKGEFVIAYAGLHGLAQGLDQVIEVAQRISQKNIRFVLVGDGPEKRVLIERAKQFSLQNIEFRDPLPKSQIPSFLASADAILVPLKTDLPGAVPSKLYEAMAVGRPVVLIAQGEAAEIVRKHHAGVVVAPGDIDGLLKSIEVLYKSPDLCAEYGTNGRLAVENEFNRKKIVEEFVEFIEGKLSMSV